MCWAGQHPPQNNNKNKNWSHSFLTQCILRPSWSNIEFEPFICDLKTEPRRSQTKNKIKPANKNSRTRSRLCVWGTVPIYSSLGLCLSFSFNFNNFNEVTRIWIYMNFLGISRYLLRSKQPFVPFLPSFLLLRSL
jgi:hypothetical protein